MVTFVTLFHPIRTDVSPQSYYSEFEHLASSGIPILLFIDSSVDFPSFPNVRRIPFTVDTSILSSDIQLPAHRSPSKDTAEFMCLMLMKLRCMAEALQYTEDAHLAWIDFRIFYVVRHKEIVREKLRALSARSFEGLTKIVIPGCWSPVPDVDILNRVCWRFCGGFFLGPRGIFESAYCRQTELVQQYLPHLTWEVNYWSRMEEFFEWYYACHDDSMIMDMPYSPRILRPGAVSHYVDGGLYRRVHVGREIEHHIFKSFCAYSDRGTVVFPRTDMLVDPPEYRRMKESVPWDDPAISEDGHLPAGDLLCLDTSRGIQRPGILYYPLDDATLVSGIRMETPPWDSRLPIAIWRGGTSGVERPSARLRVVERLLGSPFADARFVLGGWPQNDVEIPEQYVASRISMADHTRYKYMIVIDGNGAASSAQWVFATGCVPVFVTHPDTHFWLKEFLVPMMNCVIVSYDLSDIEETLQWLVDHDDEARTIATNALAFAETILSPEFQQSYLRDRIRESLTGSPKEVT